jgi:hypothetical protein
MEMIVRSGFTAAHLVACRTMHGTVAVMGLFSTSHYGRTVGLKVNAGPRWLTETDHEAVAGHLHQELARVNAAGWTDRTHRDAIAHVRRAVRDAGRHPWRAVYLEAGPGPASLTVCAVGMSVAGLSPGIMPPPPAQGCSCGRRDDTEIVHDEFSRRVHRHDEPATCTISHCVARSGYTVLVEATVTGLSVDSVDPSTWEHRLASITIELR